MSLENQKHKTLIVALSAVLVLGLTGCAAVSNLFAPPEVPSIPKWAYSRKYLKPVGMLPEAVPWAEAFWTNKNHLFVSGRPINNPGAWARYYAQLEGWEPQQVAPLWDPITGKSKPLKARGPGKSYPNRVVTQFPSGKILFSYILRHLGGKSYEDEQRLSHSLFDPETGDYEKIPAGPIPNHGARYRPLPLSENRFLYPKYEPYLIQKHDKRKFHLLLVQKDLETGNETQVMDIETTHRGELIETPDRKHLFFVVNRCVDLSWEVASGEGFYNKPCSYIDYIDLNKKTFEAVGSFSDEVVKLGNGKTKTFKQGFGQYVIALNQDQLFAFGRMSLRDANYRQIQVFNVKTGKSEIVGKLPDELLDRGIEGMQRLSDGSVVIAVNDALYLYNKPINKFYKVDDLIVPRGEYALVASPKDKVYVTGGWPIRGGDTRLIEMFDYKAYAQK